MWSLKALTRFKTAIFNNSRANNFHVSGQISLIIEPHPRSCAYIYIVQLWSILNEKCGLYCPNKVNSSCFLRKQMSPHHIPLSKQAKFFILSQGSIHVNLVKICLTFQDLLHTTTIWPKLDLFSTAVTLKKGQGHQNLVSSSSCPNVISMQI